MKKLLLVVLLLTSGYSKSLYDTLKEAGKPFDLSYTLMAIVMTESSGGKFKINLQDPSCGITMIHLGFFLKRHNKKDTPFNRNLACQQLVESDKLAIAEAVDLLEYWKSRHCSKNGCTSEQWMRVWGSYNAGNNWHGTAGRAYAKKIKSTIDAIKRHDKRSKKKRL